MQVGGDLVELTPLLDGSLLVFVADAMGHGVQAALVMSLLKGMLASMIKADMDLPALMQQLSRGLQPLLRDYFAVATCVQVDLAASRLRVVRAGMPPALLWRGRESRAVELASGGLPLAVAEEPFPLEEQPFEPGDTLFIATDGLVESQNASDEQFGQSRLRELFTQRASAGASAGDCLEFLLRQQQQFCGQRELTDDITLLAIKRA
jgi:serine phosphatase RsbU (regulator of sigma subunit)